MNGLIWKIETPRPRITGFRYLWLKTVRSFRPSVHCANCLNGDYSKRFGLKAPLNEWVHEHTMPEGTVVYFCGVSNPYKWERNAHMAGIVAPGESASIPLYTGDILRADNFKMLSITAKEAEQRFPNKGRPFLTCRNFQFGAKYL